MEIKDKIIWVRAKGSEKREHGDRWSVATGVFCPPRSQADPRSISTLLLSVNKKSNNNV